MAQYETIPQPVAAIQWTGKNLADVMTFVTPHLRPAGNFDSFEAFEKYVMETNSVLALHSDAMKSESSNRLSVGNFVARGPFGLVIMTEKTFLANYRERKEAPTLPPPILKE